MKRLLAVIIALSSMNAWAGEYLDAATRNIICEAQGGHASEAVSMKKKGQFSRAQLDDILSRVETEDEKFMAKYLKHAYENYNNESVAFRMTYAQCMDDTAPKQRRKK